MPAEELPLPVRGTTRCEKKKKKHNMIGNLKQSGIRGIKSTDQEKARD